WLQPCLLKIYSHMVTFWGNYEGISQYEALERYRDEVLTLKTPFNIVLNMINDALQGEYA
ncbi:hypothetical protein RZR40_20920, partial [Escherichia coli]|nr:hypothetical protein [Escherichia coli]MDV0925282.1 hypothetical protein [Escherichia coli]MDV0971643.1 hypothetical protein [Escherichia coli]MDV1020364.1 hypothetical protein [Escherichia coli]MDV1036999.1 hypothetical protein [Escherichia coli]